MASSVIRGVVVREGTTPPTPEPGLRVQVSLFDGRRSTLIREVATDAGGIFRVDLRKAKAGKGRLRLRIFDDKLQLEAHGATSWSSNEDPGPLTICVVRQASCAVIGDPPPSTIAGQSFLTTGVYGRVSHRDGTGVNELTVELCGVTLSEDAVLATATTTAGGWYSFAPITPAPDLIVKVWIPGSVPPELVGASKARYAPALPLRIDVEVSDDRYRRNPEYARITAALAPALGGTPVADVDVRAVAILSGRSGWTQRRVADWVLSQRIGGAISADEESVYGLIREGFPRTREGILARARSSVVPALRRSAARNIIATAKAADASAFLDALDAAHRITMLSNDPYATGATLRASGQLSDAQVDALVALRVSENDSSDAFWGRLADHSLFGSAHVAEARRLVSLGRMGLGYAPLVGSMLTAIGNAPARALGGLSLTNWATITSPTALPVLPLGLEAEDDAGKRAELANILYEQAQLEFPAEAARGAIVRSVGADVNLLAFLNANLSFDLGISDVDSFAGNPTQKQTTKAAQRLYRAGPALGRGDAVVNLMSAGYTSASEIARKGEGRFVASVGGALGPAEALEVFRKARAVEAKTTIAWALGHPGLMTPSLSFVPSDATPVSLSATFTYETALGEVDYCRCDHCRSIYGPAAYLVFLLRWLEGKDATAAAELLSRRPDIEQIALSCENTSRVLPYIDLVLEALESAVVGSGTVGIDAAHDTLTDGPELLAQPEYVKNNAYLTLAGSAIRMGLPFLRPLAEMRAFLNHLGVRRTDLMRAFQSSGSPSDEQIAIEELGLSTEGLAAITGAPTTEGAELAAYWSGVSALADLENVQTLCDAAEVAYEDVLDLAHSWYVTAGLDDFVVQVASGGDVCDLDDYELKKPSGSSTTSLVLADWQRIRQFVRLRRAAGWSILELDRVLEALEVSDLATQDFVEDIGSLHRLCSLTGIPVVEAVAWFTSRISTRDDRESKETPVLSQYAAVFLNPSLCTVEERESGDFALDSGTLEPTGTATALDEYADYLVGALATDADELQALLERLESVDPTLATTVANLAYLYAWTSIARATGLTPTDAMALSDICTIDPMSSAANAVEFVLEARELAAAGWSVDAVRYLLRDEEAERVGATESFVQAALGRLRDELRTAYGGTSASTTEESVRELVLSILCEELEIERTALEELRASTWTYVPTFPAATETEAFVFLEDTLVTLPASQVTLQVGTQVTLTTAIGATYEDDSTAASLAAVEELTFTEAPTASPQTTASLSVRVLAGGTWHLLSGGATQLPAAADVTLVAQATVTLNAGTRLTRSNGRVVSLNGNASATIPAEMVVALPVATTVTVPSTLTGADILLRFLRAAFWAASAPGLDQPWDDIVSNSATFDDDFVVVEILHKLGMLTSRVSTDADERSFWYARTADWNLASPLLLASTGSGTLTYGSLKNLIDLFGFRGRIPGSAPTYAALLEVLEAGTTFDSDGDSVADRWQFVADLAERTDWNVDDLDALADAIAPPTGSVAALASVSGLKTLLDRMDIVRRTGAAAALVTGWAVAPSSTINGDLSVEVVHAARSRYPTPAAWSVVARPVRDQLRKAQRDALVTYLTGITGLDDADDLYERYLIDVSMNPEMLTSRIKQAGCTVQLFIHRCFLGLEVDGGGNPLVQFYDDERAEWEWMRTYRVWEAARKVFLYPENWIEPELRDDKTPFFRELEEELSQGEITDERVEEVALNYLDKLRQVARMQVLGYYAEKEDGVDNLHVVARTRSDPPSYWYRVRDVNGVWSAWGQINAAVSGVQVLPIVVHRRVMVIWPETIETPVGESSDSTYKEVRLGTSEYRAGKWSPKRMSDVGVSVGTLEGGEIRLVTSEGEDGLDVAVEYVDGSTSYGTFTWDACTDAFTTRGTQARHDAMYLARPPNHEHQGWRSPEFQVDDATLALYVGSIDENGELQGVPNDKDVLYNGLSANLVVAHQHNDYVSQLPCFVNLDDRSFLVEYEKNGTIDAFPKSGGTVDQGTGPPICGGGDDPPGGGGGGAPPIDIPGIVLLDLYGDDDGANEVGDDGGAVQTMERL